MLFWARPPFHQSSQQHPVVPQSILSNVILTGSLRFGPLYCRCTVFLTHIQRIQFNPTRTPPHGYSMFIVPCCAVVFLLIGPTTQDLCCLCISQQRPAQKCMAYVFEHGRIQKQLPGLNTLTAKGEHRCPWQGRVSTLHEQRGRGCFWTRTSCVYPFSFLLVCQTSDGFSCGTLDLRALTNLKPHVYRMWL